MNPIATAAVQVLLLFAAATFAFDCIHFTLHQLLRSRHPWLVALGRLHQAHHDFFDTRLRLHEELIGRNLLHHVVPEVLTQLAVTSVAFAVLPPWPVLAAMAVEVAFGVSTLLVRGKDPYHRPVARVPAPRSWVVTPEYHAVHHVHPDTHYGSYTVLFDMLLGTAVGLKGRTVALTGAGGAFGSALRELLEAEGARVVPLKFGAAFDGRGVAESGREVLASADLLVLAHGSRRVRPMEGNCDSFVALIETFKALTAGRQVPPEVWALGSEIEAHPSFGIAELQAYSASKRAFARHARRYAQDREICYRHIVPSAFRSAMGPGLISARMAARAALFLIRRGFRYVPVTYTGVALVNYLKYRFGPRAPAPVL